MKVAPEVGKRIFHCGIMKSVTDYLIRNSGFSALWQDCYFMPSACSEKDMEINSFIIENREGCSNGYVCFPEEKHDPLLCCLAIFIVGHQKSLNQMP